MNTSPLVATIASTLAGAAVIVAQSAVEDGLGPTTGWAGGIIGAGVAVFLFFWRAMRADQAKAEAARREHENDVAAQRRIDDERVQAELARLRRRNDELVDRLIQYGIKLPERHE